MPKTKEIGMNQEELNALIESKDFRWDKEELMPQIIKNEEESSQTEEAKQLQANLLLKQMQYQITQTRDDLEQVAEVSLKTQRAVQEILNFNIRQLEIFEKLVHKFPGIKVFQNSFEETQEMIEKIIKIQEDSVFCANTAQMALKKNDTQKDLHQKISEILLSVSQINRYIQAIFEAKVEPNQLQKDIAQILNTQGEEDK